MAAWASTQCGSMAGLNRTDARQHGTLYNHESLCTPSASTSRYYAQPRPLFPALFKHLSTAQPRRDEMHTEHMRLLYEQLC